MQQIAMRSENREWSKGINVMCRKKKSQANEIAISQFNDSKVIWNFLTKISTFLSGYLRTPAVPRCKWHLVVWQQTLFWEEIRRRAALHTFIKLRHFIRKAMKWKREVHVRTRYSRPAPLAQGKEQEGNRAFWTIFLHGFRSVAGRKNPAKLN